MSTGTSIYYKIYGHGQPLLLVHGWAMHSGVWSGLIEELSGSFEIIPPDLRGHGKSREVPGPYTYDVFARDIIDLVRGLGRARITALGWSMGASVLLNACARSPELFDRLVFMSGNPSLVSRPDYACGIPMVTVQRLYRQVERTYPEGLKNFYSLLLAPDEQALYAHDPRYATLTEPAAAPDKDAALVSLRCLMEEDLRQALACVTSPTLIMHGASDGICLPSAASFMHEKIPGSRLVLFEKTGHMPFLTRRHDTCRELHAFLGSSA